MISVENFYWILFENLLRPTGLDCWYYYPFGTTNNLVRTPTLCRSSTGLQVNPHVLFHFDQEPLYTDSLGDLYDKEYQFLTGKVCKLLANSEHSTVKHQICQERTMQDWYYFYHGFAALAWFRDSQYITRVQPWQKVFCSFNHLVKSRRSYRLALTSRLLDKGLSAFGDISLHCTQKECADEINDPISLLCAADKNLIARILLDKTNLPLIVDSHYVSGSFSAHFGDQEYHLWQNYLWHVVNETVFYENKLHLTEKIFKPIVCERPFLLVSSPGSLAYLRQYGFETFDKWIDESYDNEPNHSCRLDMIVEQLKYLCNLSRSALNSMKEDMQEVLHHNKLHFFGDFKKIIVEELVDNFDRCTRLWNNGRIDVKHCVHHPDLGIVKQILSR